MDAEERADMQKHFTEEYNRADAAEAGLAKARKLLSKVLVVWNHDRSMKGDAHKRIIEFLYKPDKNDSESRREDGT